ncbi:MAG TPA: thiamine phosphate synthase [Acidimicrobiales bacterium]|nr:thiamine phosphate synthase [Acidimicrobiales bacterium]
MSGAAPLPPLVLVADSSAVGGRPLAQVVAQAVAGGVRAVWLRDKQARPQTRRRLAAALAEVVHAAGGVLLASPGPGTELADGIQLGASDPWEPAGFGPRPVGRSCHGRDELARAAAAGYDWATLSPIYPSAAKPGYGPVLGTGALAAAPLPVWALGGLSAANAAECLVAGASGVAVMGAVLAPADPEAAAADICRVIGALPEVSR